MEYLKNLVFKVAENTFKPDDPSEWPNILDMPLEERRANSSIFIDANESAHGETVDGFTLHATVSSTLIILTDTNQMYFWERIYSHPTKPGEPMREISSLELDLAAQLSKALPYLDPVAHFTTVPFEEKLI